MLFIAAKVGIFFHIPANSVKLFFTTLYRKDFRMCFVCFGENNVQQPPKNILNASARSMNIERTAETQKRISIFWRSDPEMTLDEINAEIRAERESNDL